MAISARMELRFTTTPAPRARMPGTKAWTRRTGPKKCASNIARTSSSRASSAGPTWPSPPLFTSTSTSRTFAARRSTLRGSTRSSGRYVTLSTRSAALSRRGSRHVPKTSWPSAASAAAIAFPMPREAPVTSARIG